MVKEYWITDSRFKYIGVLLMIIWLGIMGFYYLKADEITKDPCAICSEKMGEDVVCTTSSYIPVSRVYYPNGTVYTDTPQVKREVTPQINLSAFMEDNKVEE